MSSFTSELVVSPLSSGRKWKLIRPFRFHIGSRYSNNIIAVPAGFVTDFASIPKFLFFLPYWAKYNKAPIVHDYCYQSKCVPRVIADAYFLEAMLVAFQPFRTGKFVAYLEYYAVRMFGWLGYKGNSIK